jgi:hypothetical protein
MSHLFEDPTAAIVLGLMAELVLVVLLFKTGRGVVLIPVVAVAVVAGIWILTERLVVTERERVEGVVEQMRAAFVTNEPDRVLALIAADAGPLRTRATAFFRTFHIHALKITDGPQIVVNEMTDPPTATIALLVRASGRPVAGAAAYDRALVRIDARLERQSGGWRFIEADHAAPFGR